MRGQIIRFILAISFICGSIEIVIIPEFIEGLQSRMSLQKCVLRNIPEKWSLVV
jgi:hypothetical protein